MRSTEHEARHNGQDFEGCKTLIHDVRGEEPRIVANVHRLCTNEVGRLVPQPIFGHPISVIVLMAIRALVWHLLVKTSGHDRKDPECTLASLVRGCLLHPFEAWVL